MTGPNASSRKDIRAQEKAAKLSQMDDGEVIQNLMSTVVGRKWMWEVLERCHIFAASFTSDPLFTAYAEGERNQGLQFLNSIMIHCPDLYIQAARESNDRRSASERARSSDRDGGDQGRLDSDSEPDDPRAEPGSSPGSDIYN